MATIAETRVGTHARHAYLILIHGVPFGFTDEPELANGWWEEDERVIKLGLTVPETLKISLELESGLIEEDQATFRLLDIDSTVPEFFGGINKKFKLLGPRLTPLEDPAPASFDSNSQALDLTSSYIGTEALGPDGERNWFSCTPWAPMPGQDHPSYDEPMPVVTSSTIGPYLIEGRRVALYRLYYDEDAGHWESFTKQTADALEGGWSPMLWWGTLRQAGKVDGRIWTINCTGPGSWLRRSLNSRTTPQWYGVTADFDLADNERHIGITFNKRYYEDGSYIMHGNTYSAYLVDPTSKATIISSINTAITATAAAAGVDGVWTDVQFIGAGSIEFTEDWIKIDISMNIGYQANMKLTLARKVWRALGYDPDAGVGNNDGPGPRFNPGAGGNIDFINANPDILVDPPPVYHTAHITTCPEGEDPSVFTGEIGWASSGLPRVYYPTYSAGVSVLSGQGGQIVHITPFDNEEIYCETQTIRAHEQPFVEINGNPCNAGRLWAFRGKIQLPKLPTQAEQPDPIDTIQIAHCYWVEFESGIVGVDETGISRGLYIDYWVDPRLFGYNYEPIDPATGWASNDGGTQIECSPMALFGGYYRNPDHAAYTIIRTLLSTGTAEWDPGQQDTPPTHDLLNPNQALDACTPGLNDLGLGWPNALNVRWPCGDYEIYDMGLQIPKEMVDHISILDAGKDLPGGENGPLALGKVAIQGGPLQSEELFEGLMAPRGWAFQLKRGKFGIYAPHISAEEKFQEGVDFEITESDLHGTAGDPGSVVPSVELRPVNPFDRVTWTYAGNPSESWVEGQEELKFKARDPGARARSGSRVRDIAAPDLIATQWFVSGDQNNPHNAEKGLLKSWTGDVSKLWERDIPRWLAQPHRLVTNLRISRPKGQDIYPGAILKLTNPWPANSTGTYGVSGAFARVLSVTHETNSCAVVVECLLEANPPGQLRWAPVARVIDDAAETSDRYDASTRTFYCEDWGGVVAPVSAFVKPAYVDEVDEPAKIIVLQYDGVSPPSITCSGFVESVNTVAKSITLTIDGLTGTFYERMYSLIVLAPSTDGDQVDWCRALYAEHVLFDAPGAAHKLIP